MSVYVKLSWHNRQYTVFHCSTYLTSVSGFLFAIQSLFPDSPAELWSVCDATNTTYCSLREILAVKSSSRAGTP
jgi:hypothetical protein